MEDSSLTGLVGPCPKRTGEHWGLGRNHNTGQKTQFFS